MFTERKHVYVLHNHHLVMVLVEDSVVEDVCVKANKQQKASQAASTSHTREQRAFLRKQNLRF